MGFTDKQIADLSAKLSPDVVKSREQGGRALSYIEGWHAIAEANRIFGFDGWDRETIYLKEVCRIEKTDKYGKPQWKVGYEAKVRITVYGTDADKTNINTREGTGYGQGTMGDLYDAMESAGKEAETDAMKRALMTFGNPFGLALYDKDRTNVGHEEPKLDATTLAGYKMALEQASNLTELQDVFTQIFKNGHAVEELVTIKDIRKKKLS